ncbi:LPD1 domain-containing protein [Pontibacillus salicampi]|uniref:LPD1 domain-containing protein n=1 Tax=Pontibacillus salicampi TaxID=1449801 RepID=A0ABV6LTG9_9BACI
MKKALLIPGKYWSSPVELALSGFESYFSYELAGKGWKNYYVVSGFLLPMRKERKRMNESFDKLMSVVRKIHLLEGTYYRKHFFNMKNRLSRRSRQPDFLC